MTRIHFTLTNEDEGHSLSEWSEDFPDEMPMGEIYREVQKEFGRCESSVYVDTPMGAPRRIGWFFVSRQRYEDTGEPYLRGAWVTLQESA